LNLQVEIKKLTEELFPYLVNVRRHLHQNPELSFKEYNTSKYIQEQLTSHNISFKANVAGTGIVATIEGQNPNSDCVLLRADMDALPIQETNNVSYKSINNGVMHACGHDVHSTCVLGTAIIINQLKNNLKGTIKIVFQPGEEVLPGGAKLMIDEGILENPKVNKAIALHVFPNLEVGKVGFKEGMYMASTDELYLTINGKGGHAAMPSEYINPLIIASEIILKINQEFMLEPKNDIPAVIAFGKISGDGATNVIPEQVKIAGTFRTMNENWREDVHQKLHEIVTSFSKKYKIQSHLEVVKGYPYLINDNLLTQTCRTKAISVLGQENVIELPLRMTAEDFAYITQKIPSCFFRLGTANTIKKINAGVHTSNFDVDENSIKVGVELLSNLFFI
jgi:amidohydrolase